MDDVCTAESVFTSGLLTSSVRERLPHHSGVSTRGHSRVGEPCQSTREGKEQFFDRPSGLLVGSGLRLGSRPPSACCFVTGRRIELRNDAVRRFPGSPATRGYSSPNHPFGPGLQRPQESNLAGRFWRPAAPPRGALCFEGARPIPAFVMRSNRVLIYRRASTIDLQILVAGPGFEPGTSSL